MQNIIRTYTGKDFDFLKPDTELIDIQDIAHHLSMTTRYSGSPKHYYSVAEHSYFASKICPKKWAFMILLHDAAEAYVTDIISALKKQLPRYKYIEDKIMEKVWWKFGIHMDYEMRGDFEKIQNETDHIMFQEENLQILNHPYKFDHNGNDLKGYKCKLKLRCLDPEGAKLLFLHRFNELKGK